MNQCTEGGTEEQFKFFLSLLYCHLFLQGTRHSQFLQDRVEYVRYSFTAEQNQLSPLYHTIVKKALLFFKFLLLAGRREIPPRGCPLGPPLGSPMFYEPFLCLLNNRSSCQACDWLTTSLGFPPTSSIGSLLVGAIGHGLSIPLKGSRARKFILHMVMLEDWEVPGNAALYTAIYTTTMLSVINLTLEPDIQNCELNKL